MEDQKIFVLIPSGTSGGHESLHQMVSILNDHGADAYVYYPDQEDAAEVPEKFKKYNVKIAENIEDVAENILVVSELCTNHLYRYKNIQKVIWWLSWNFYAENEKWMNRGVMDRIIHGEWKSAARLMKKRALGMGKVFSFGEDKNDIFHFFNCEYIKENLQKRGVEEENMMYLCGPISEHYFTAKKDRKKEAVLVYNPAKGLAYTNSILEMVRQQRPELEIVPIKNMTPEQIVQLLARAKVYIDFGYFPGPERIPREAVTMRCNIITSTEGSAGNDEDVKIPRVHKFDINTANKQDIVNAIFDRMDHYERYVSDYDVYREKVLQQRTLLEKNILQHFGIASVKDEEA